MYTMSSLLHDAWAMLTSMNTTNLILVVALLASISYGLYKTSNPRKLPLPPGPRPWPIIGNALDVPRDAQWSTFMKWAKEYGAFIFCVTMI